MEVTAAGLLPCCNTVMNIAVSSTNAIYRLYSTRSRRTELGPRCAVTGHCSELTPEHRTDLALSLVCYMLILLYANTLVVLMVFTVPVGHNKFNTFYYRIIILSISH